MQDLVTDDALVAQGQNGAALGLEHITHHPLIARAAGVEIVGFVVELAGAHGELAFAEAAMAMREQTTALVTGANKGIGYAIAAWPWQPRLECLRGGSG